MAIDRPLDQGTFLVRSEQAQGGALAEPVKLAGQFLSVIANAAKALKTGNLPEAMASVAQALKGVAEFLGDQNVEYLLSIVISEVETLWSKFDELDQKHREFLDTDWPTLVVDGQRRARIVRAKEKVRRIALVLANAAKSEPPPQPDDVEEMMRIAMELSDRDVIVLREIVHCQGPMIRKDTLRVRHFDAHSVCRQIIGALQSQGFPAGEVDSICAKLESFGLVSKSERNVNLIADDPTPYALLQKGLDFISYIRAESEGEPSEEQR